MWDQSGAERSVHFNPYCRHNQPIWKHCTTKASCIDCIQFQCHTENTCCKMKKHMGRGMDCTSANFQQKVYRRTSAYSSVWPWTNMPKPFPSSRAFFPPFFFFTPSLHPVKSIPPRLIPSLHSHSATPLPLASHALHFLVLIWARIAFARVHPFTSKTLTSNLYVLLLLSFFSPGLLDWPMFCFQVLSKPPSFCPISHHW